MTSEPLQAEVLEIARLAAARGEFRLTEHVKRERMPERNAKLLDIRQAMLTATRATQQSNGTYRLYGGLDLDNDELVVVIDISDGVVVVTIM